MIEPARTHQPLMMKKDQEDYQRSKSKVVDWVVVGKKRRLVDGPMGLQRPLRDHW